MPFSLHTRVWHWSLLLSPSEEDANLDCQDPRPALPPLSRGTPLYAARTFLYPRRSSGHPAQSSLAQPWCRVCFWPGCDATAFVKLPSVPGRIWTGPKARQQGFEPQLSHPKCDVLPLNYCRKLAERSCRRMSASGCYSSGIAVAGSHLARLQLYPNHACASIWCAGIFHRRDAESAETFIIGLCALCVSAVNTC